MRQFARYCEVSLFQTRRQLTIGTEAASATTHVAYRDVDQRIFDDKVPNTLRTCIWTW